MSNQISRKTYVLDTNVLMVSPFSIFAFDEHNIIIADATLEELDRNKNKPGEAGANTREVIRALEGFRSQGNLLKGVELPGGGNIRIVINKLSSNDMEYSSLLPEAWDRNRPDNQILSVCSILIKQGLSPILVSNDIDMRIKADLIGVTAEEYRTEQVYKPSEQFKGRRTCYVPPEAIGRFYSERRLSVGDIIAIDSLDSTGGKIDIEPNEFFVIVDAADEKHTALGRFDGKEIVPLFFENAKPYGVTPRNAGQRFAQEALLTGFEKAPLVILKGAAGTAKTFLSLACGLEQTLNREDGGYKRILVSRPNIKFDEDIGFLKGTEEEKIGPLIRPIFDNLETLTKIEGRKDNHEYGSYVQDLFDTGVITAQALAYMRGRSISDTWIILDEAQNMSPTQAFGIISRVGEGSKVILAGDPDQIDNPHLDSRTNGLSYASERMKGSPLCWQVTFNDKECVRSKLALEAISRMSPKGYQGRAA